MYQSSQQRVFWGHLNTVILSESVLKQDGLLGIFDSLIRYPEIRYTPWIFGTKVEIEKLFTTKPFFHLSPLNSLLYSPESNYSQRPAIPPMRLSRFIREIREPGKTVDLPSLNITRDTWKKDRKPDPKLEIDGIFALHGTRYMKWFPVEQLPGIRWFGERKQGARILLKEGHDTVAVLRMQRPGSKIRVRMEKDEPVFDVDVRVSASIIEMRKKKTEREYERMAVRTIADQIRSTHRTGGEVDILDLEHSLYRKNYPAWKKLTSDGQTPLQPIRLGNVNVAVHIVQSGMYKLNRKMTPY